MKPEITNRPCPWNGAVAKSNSESVRQFVAALGKDPEASRALCSAALMGVSLAVFMWDLKAEEENGVLPLTMIGPEDLGESVAIGDQIRCTACGELHELEGSRDPQTCDLLLTYRCPKEEKTYLGGFNGRLLL